MKPDVTPKKTSSSRQWRGRLFRLAGDLRQRAGWWRARAWRKVLGRHVELVADDGHWSCCEEVVDWR
jgi:hypothetical protein